MKIYGDYVRLILLILSLLISACDSQKPNKVENEPPVTPLIETPGQYLVYVVNEYQLESSTKPRTAFILIAATDASRRDIVFSYNGWIYHIVPSPLGNSIAFVAGVKGEGIGSKDEKHLMLYDIKTKKIVDYSAPGQNTRHVTASPIFTPDGSKILFISRWSSETGEYNIFASDVESGITKGLFTQPVEDIPLTLTPSGDSVIAVQRVQGKINTFEYIKISIATGQSQKLHQFSDVTKIGPAFMASDGNRIFCDIKPYGVDPFAGGPLRLREIVEVDLSSGTQKKLIESNSVTYMYQVFYDEDGNEKLLVRRQEEAEGEETLIGRLAILNSDGKGFMYITPENTRSSLPGPPSNIPPVSPDRKLIFYYLKDPVFDFTDIFVMNSDGTNPVNISNTAGYSEGSAGWIIIR